MKIFRNKNPNHFDHIIDIWKKEANFKQNYQDLEIKVEISLQLIQARVNAGLTQKEVATRMGTTQSVIARLESGTTLPTVKTLMLYAKAIGKHLHVSLNV
jgi:ribosome-binding protein aMBF1 (putative translation factor)